MTTITHGTVVPLETNLEFSPATNGDAPTLELKPSWPFWYMFEKLQDDPAALLETSTKTVDDLKLLGQTMIEATTVGKPGVKVPAIYTFFGQFVDHDITLDKGSSKNSLANPSPIPLKQIKSNVVNSRSPNLDLDNVYGPDLDGQLAPRNGDKLRLGRVEGSQMPPRKDECNDLPRRADGSAIIGDPRNDENIVISQLHVAFLRAHNRLVEEHHLTFEGAQKTLIQHYQWIVLNEFLGKIADPDIVEKVRNRPPQFFKPEPDSLFMPLEFSVAAYRFGHSKVRASYDRFSEDNQGGELGLLFSLARQPLPKRWVIDWTHFVKAENDLNFPRPIDTTLTKLLLELLPAQLLNIDSVRNLATRNLLRGYILNLPTGQAVAKAMESDGIVPMTDQEIESVTQINGQFELLKETGFLKNTPLWFYILAEAARLGKGGAHLGPVGSTIVTEVLLGILRNSTFSILAEPQWKPSLGNGEFDLEDLLRFAEVF